MLYERSSCSSEATYGGGLIYRDCGGPSPLISGVHRVHMHAYYTHSVSDTSMVWAAPYRGQVRLVNENTTSATSSGRVEVFQAHLWGTVCNQGFNQAAADTVCRQLGYTNAVAVTDAR